MSGAPGGRNAGVSEPALTSDMPSVPRRTIGSAQRDAGRGHETGEPWRDARRAPRPGAPDRRGRAHRHVAPALSTPRCVSSLLFFFSPWLVVVHKAGGPEKEREEGPWTLDAALVYASAPSALPATLEAWALRDRIVRQITPSGAEDKATDTWALRTPGGTRTLTLGDFKSPASASWATGARGQYAAPPGHRADRAGRTGR